MILKPATIQPALGRGVYSLPEVAALVKKPYRTVHSWFKSIGVLTSDYSQVDDKFAVSFFDLIDTLVAARFREVGVPMHEVRRAYAKLSVRLGTAHPFCHRGLYATGRRVIVDVAENIGSVKLQDAVSNQGWLSELKECLHSVSYSNLTRLAERWNIARGVVVDPSLALGQPVIQGTGVTTFVASRAYYANGKDAAFVARLYGLTSTQVKNAVNFERGSKTAA